MAQLIRNSSASVSATSTEILPANVKRVAFSVIPLTTGVVVTLAKGSVVAVAGNGVVLTKNQPYFESDGQPFHCWRGPVQAVSDASGTVAISEVIEV